MEIRENSLAIACLIALALLFPLSRSQDYINAHNAARAEVGVGPPSWDDNVGSICTKLYECTIEWLQNRTLSWALGTIIWFPSQDKKIACMDSHDLDSMLIDDIRGPRFSARAYLIPIGFIH
jgi:hypothetical protein